MEVTNVRVLKEEGYHGSLAVGDERFVLDGERLFPGRNRAVAVKPFNSHLPSFVCPLSVVEALLGGDFGLPSPVQVAEQLALLDDMGTGDEIHMSSGDVWSCVPKSCGGVVDLGIFFIKASFADARANHGQWPYPRDEIAASMAKPLFVEAICGGARIVKGAGLAPEKPKRRRSTSKKAGQASSAEGS